jgi:hypothetical protein
VTRPASVDLNRVDGFDLMTKLTKRGLQFVNVVFALREKGEPAATAAVAQRFKDCSLHLAASVLHEAADAGAVTEAEDGWHVTPESVAAMRIGYKGWSDAYDSEAEQRGLR